MKSFSDSLFTFQGRLNRAKFWLYFLFLTLILFAIYVVALIVLPRSVGPFIALLVSLVSIVPYAFLTIQRLHDRDKSGHWLWLFYALPLLLSLVGVLITMQVGEHWPYLVLSMIGMPISLWALVEIGFLRGTVGPNRFGADPLPASA